MPYKPRLLRRVSRFYWGGGASFPQIQILAVWILAAKLPDSDLNFAVDFWVDVFPPVFSKGKRAERIH